jgi:hypothetical protein
MNNPHLRMLFGTVCATAISYKLKDSLDHFHLPDWHSSKEVAQTGLTVLALGLGAHHVMDYLGDARDGLLDMLDRLGEKHVPAVAMQPARRYVPTPSVPAAPYVAYPAEKREISPFDRPVPALLFKYVV